MENASNALIMAGEILIAVLIISLMVAVNSMFGSFSRNINDRIADNRVTQFNNHFYNYMNRANISASDVASIINFAKIANDENGYKRINPDDRDANRKNPYYINVYINDESYFYCNNADYKSFLSKNSTDDDVYSNDLEFKARLNEFLTDFNTDVFVCNAKKIYIKTPKKTDIDDLTRGCNYVVYIDPKANTSGENADVSTKDQRHPDAKQDGDPKVTRINFYTLKYFASLNNKYVATLDDNTSISNNENKLYDITNVNEIYFTINKDFYDKH